MNSENAVAGPSSLANSILPFLPPAGPPRPTAHFTSTEDLLARFHLVSSYDKYVRPFVDDGSADKGKGKERDISPSPEPTPAGAMDVDDDDDDKRKKRNNYRHLIKGVPGRHSMKKDDYLTNMMQVPPKQRINVTPFDLKTQRDAFSVSLDGLKGWNINTLVAESPQAREDRRKRKELKRLQKAHQAGLPLPQAVTTPSAPTNGAATPSVAHSVSTPIPARAATPKPAVAHPGSRPPIPATTELPRGQKREHEDSVPPQQQKSLPTPIAGAKAGNNGVRPRPLKKQRMDLQGQARDIPVHQQPTPQGV